MDEQTFAFHLFLIKYFFSLLLPSHLNKLDSIF